MKGFAETHRWVVQVPDFAQELMESRAAVLEQLSALRWYESRWGQVRRDRTAEILGVIEGSMKGYEAVAAKLKELDEQETAEARRLVEEANEAQRLRKWVVREKVE